nr:serine/threonine-protein kinase STY46-like isoform X2 [Ipomoea batatas]
MTREQMYSVSQLFFGNLQQPRYQSLLERKPRRGCSFRKVNFVSLMMQVPYNTMTPLQAAVGVRQGLRPEIPTDSHPKLVELMQRSWKEGPSDRPSFSDLRVQLEELLKDVNVEEDATEAAKGS